MAVKLIIPQLRMDSPQLRRGSASRKRGAEGRRLERARQEQLERNREAGLWVVAHCAVLWGLFWFQFVIGFIHNQPALYTFSDGNWYAPAFHFYLENNGPFAWSLAGTFVSLSVLASVVAMCLSWISTRGVAGKWRLRMVVLLFAIIVCGWSIAALKAENGVWVGVERSLAKARKQWRSVAELGEDEWTLRFYREEVERLEKLLETKPNLPDWR